MSAIGRFWTESILPRMPRTFRREFWRILFSFFFALLLTWFVHKSVKEETEYHPIVISDVEVRAVPEEDGGKDPDFVLVPWDIPPTVSVKIAVPVDTKDVKNKDMYVECPVTKEQIDKNEPVVFDPGTLKVRRSIDYREVRIEPALLHLNLDYYVEKDIPVKPEYDPNEVVNGYQLDGEPKAETETVRIRGPKKVLAKIDGLVTEKVPLSNVTNSFSCPVRPVLPYDVKKSDVTILSDSVRVDVRIKKNFEKDYRDIPVHVITGKDVANGMVIAEILPETVKVWVEDLRWRNPRQDRNELREITRDQIHAVLNLSNVKEPGNHPVRIQCWSDNEGYRVVKVEPAEATVVLKPNPGQPSN